MRGSMSHYETFRPAARLPFWMLTAFEDTAQRYQRRVYSFARYLLSSREEAEDVTQEVLLRLWRHRQGVDEERLGSWLLRVTRNACYDLLRKRARQPLLDLGDDEHPRPEPTPAPDHADATELSIDVQRALLEVPEDFRAVMILHDVQDLPQEEVAAILGIPVGTVKSRLHRGRIALAKAMHLERERPHPSEPSDGAVAR